MQTNQVDRNSNEAGLHASQGSALAALAADHEQVRQLAEDFQAALEAGSDEQADLVRKLCDAIELHSALEEEILYPAVAKIDELTVLIDKSRDDHSRVHEIVDEIRATDPGDEQVAGLVLQLAEDIEQHAAEEESVLFPEIEQRMGDRLAALGAEMERMRRRMGES